MAHSMDLQAYNREASRKQRVKRKKQRRCTTCGGKRKRGYLSCDACIEAAKERNKGRAA